MKPDIEECNKKIFNKGIHVFTAYSISKENIEEWVRKIANLSGQPVDWHYSGGRAIIKALGNINKVMDAIDSLKPEYDKLMREAVPWL